MLAVNDLKIGFGETEVLSGVTFKVPSSGVVGLIGPSGGGKSVLLKIIGQVLEADSGELDNGGIGESDISLMFQEGALFDSLNVFDNCAFPLVRGRVPTFTLSRAVQRQVHEKVDYLLARVGLSDAAQKMPGQLSGGMRRRLSLARALVSEPKLLLLDDPTCGLDPVASSVIMDLIIELQHVSRPTTIMVSHDLRRLLPVVDSVIALFDGVVAFHDEVKALQGCGNDYVKRFVACRYDLANGCNSGASTPGTL